MKLLTVVGTRPNLIKAAPILKALSRTADFHSTLVHTGQHFDATMSEVFIRELSLPTPDHHLDVGPVGPVVQTALIMQRLEEVLTRQRPDAVLVIGDVTSTVAAAMTAAQMGIPVAHVEAGVRSFDRTMPEELNRVVTDALAGLLLAPTPDACGNLRREGVPEERVVLVGNVLADALHASLPAARGRRPWERLGLNRRAFALVTVHRPANVDDSGNLAHTMAVLRATTVRLPAVLSLHPRTARRIAETDLESELRSIPGLVVCPPFGYLDFVALQEAAAVIITDSGGVQVESSVLGTPCLTLRRRTEWPVTVSLGTNRLVGCDLGELTAGIESAIARTSWQGARIELWDGHAAERVIAALATPGWTSWDVGRPAAACDDNSRGAGI